MAGKRSNKDAVLPNVLLIDDDETILDILAVVFEHAGARTTLMSKSREALELALEQQKFGRPFDLVVVDIRMPHMDGNEVARSLRAGGYTGPIVAFTATATGEGRNESKDAGIVAYLSKATLKPDLVRAILEQYCVNIETA